MKHRLFFLPVLLLPLLVFLIPGITSSNDEAEVGKAAPTFTLPGTDGKTYTLEDFEDKFVVLEWLNFGCPYVSRHYRSGNMPQLQSEFTEKEVVWLSVVSSAPGKQGYYEADAMNKENEKFGGLQTAILLDPSGDTGRIYGAKTTPHMYIINPDGTLIYKGGIDDKPRASLDETASAHNYVRAALSEAMEGKEVSTKTARPYGCSVKY